MKKKMIIIFIFLVLVLTGFKSNLNPPFFPLSGMLIIVDPGHGGKDPGTLYNDIYEKDIVLKIATQLEKKLTLKGASVIMTRTGDYDLSKPNATSRKKSDFDNRIELINGSKANFYLSIHLNFLNQKQYFGGQVFYNKENKQLAQSIQLSFNEELNSNREIKLIPSTNYMYEKLNINGVLIECGFLSNANERNKLITSSYQEEIANVIVTGLINYIYD